MSTRKSTAQRHSVQIKMKEAGVKGTSAQSSEMEEYVQSVKFVGLEGLGC